MAKPSYGGWVSFTAHLALKKSYPLFKKQNQHITESAKNYLSEMIEQHKKKYVRLAVQGGGCSGFKYDWDFTDEPEGKVVEGILELDPTAEMFVFGCTVDYVRELGGNYLVVKNPNATAQCGCGESFAV